MKSALALALALGVTVPEPTAAPEAPAAVEAPSEPSRDLSGGGTVTGTAYGHCPMGANGGYRTASVQLRGTIQLTNSDGVHASVSVSGGVFLSGSCNYGSGTLAGSGTVSGSAQAYDRKGRALGWVRVSEQVRVSQYGPSSMTISERISVRERAN